MRPPRQRSVIPLNLLLIFSFLSLGFVAGGVFAPLREGALSIALFVSLLTVAAASTALAWRHQRSLFYRKQYEAERKRKAFLQRFEFLTKYANDIILLLDPEGRIVEANERALTAYGYTREEILNLNIKDLRATETKSFIEDDLKRIQEENGLLYETMHQKRDGTVFPVEVSARYFDIEGKHYYQGILRDITERKEAERKIQHMTRLYAVLSQINQTVVRVRDKDTLFQEICRIAVELGNFSLAWVGFIDPETRMIIPSALSGNEAGYLNHIRISLDDKNCERALRLKEGKSHIINDIENSPSLLPEREQALKNGYRSSAAVPISVNQEVIGAFSICASEPDFFDEDEIKLLEEIGADISFALERFEAEKNRKQAEERLQTSEQFLSSIFTSIQDGISILDNDFTIIRVNPLMEQQFAHAQPLVGKKCYEVYHGRREPCEVCHSRRTLQTGQSDHAVIPKAVPGEESMGWLDVYTFPLLDQVSGKINGVIEYVRDITERKQMEETLRENVARYRGMFEHTNNGVAVYKAINNGEDFVFVDFNPAAEKIEKISGAEIIGKSVIEVFPGVKEFGLLAVFQRVWATGEPEHHPLSFYKDERVSGWKDNFVFKLPSGEIVAVYSDETDRIKAEQERQEMEKQLRQAQKMEAIGTLAGGIAHDFNNILTAIIGNAELARFEISKNAPVQKKLDQVLKAGNRAKDLVKQILAFSRKTEEEKKPVAVNVMVKEVLKLLRASIPATIEISYTITAHNDTILADLTQVHQVIMNLCTNAHHAMQEKGGILEILVGNVDFESESTARQVGLNPGRHLTLTVRDTGHGMTPEVMTRIFDPYFTTKGKGTGTGMGLAVVLGIMKSHRGAITVESEPGKGSTFRVFFPSAEEKKVTAAEAKKAEVLLTGKERILLVDDEETLADVGKKLLEQLGYQVVVRTSSTAALELFRTNPDQFDLVITDMTMPRMTGEKLAQALMGIRPDIPIILCTGFSEIMTAEKAKALGIKEFVMKPYVTRDLASTIRRVLDKKSGSSRNRVG